MPLVPDLPIDISPGIVSPTDLNLISRAVRFGQNAPRFNLRQNTLQPISNATDTAITFDAELLDTDIDGVGGHDNVTNNNRFTFRYPGTYWCSGAVCYATNATSLRWAWFRLNGVNVTASVATSPATSVNVAAVPVRSCPIQVNIGDILELIAHQTSGGSLNTAVASPSYQSSMSGIWICR